MIKYALKCSSGHSFESWFQDSDAYQKLSDTGHLTCAVCGISEVEKAIMAPRVNVPADAPLSAPASPAEQAIKEIRAKVEAEADNVGRNFASEARAIHLGEKPERAIYGEARLDEAKALIDDGVQIAPLPWGPAKSN